MTRNWKKSYNLREIPNAMGLAFLIFFMSRFSFDRKSLVLSICKLRTGILGLGIYYS